MTEHAAPKSVVAEAPAGEAAAYSLEAVRRLARQTLDRLAVTDLSYHDLLFAEPLVVDLLWRVVQRVPRGGRLLLIGPNSYLARALADQGYEIEIWRFGENYLLEELEARIAGEVTPEQLGTSRLPFAGPYDGIVLPLVFEHLQVNPAVPLEALRGCLAPGGCLLLATTNLGRLGARLRAVLGMAYLPDWKSEPQPALGGWPRLRQYRFYQPGELVSASEAAGYRVEEWAFSVGQQAFSQILPLTVSQYAALKIKHGLKSAIRRLSDYIVMTLRLPGREDGRELLPALVDREAWQAGDDGQRPLPFVSVVLPTHNRSAILRDALESLYQQSYPADRYEIVVIDDSSQDETPEVIRELAPKSPCRFVTERTTGLGAAGARNLGMRLASGEIVAHTDDDCRVWPGWIENGVLGFERNVALVSGPVHPKPEQHRSFFGWFMLHPDDNGTYPTSNIFYRRDVILGEGGFDESFGHNLLGRPVWGWDSDLAWRLLRRGHEARFRAEAHVYTEIFRLGIRRWLLEGWRFGMLPGVVRIVPELRRTALIGRLFVTHGTMCFELGLLASLLALLRRQPRWHSLWLPWLGLALHWTQADYWPPMRWPRIPVKVAFLFAAHVVTIAALVYGSIRARRLVL